VLPTAIPSLFVAPSNINLIGAELELVNLPERETRLREAIAPCVEAYDYIIIDCPPSLGLLTVNALTAAAGVLIPIQCEYYALEGLSALLDTIEKVRRSTNPSLRVEGLLRTMFDPRNRLANDVSAQLLQHFGDIVYGTLIPRNVRLAEAPSHGLPVIAYDKSSKGAESYQELAKELQKRTRKQNNARVVV